MKLIYTILTGLLILSSPSVLAQGSIFGMVENSNLTIPADSEISFFGFLDDTDEEVRIEICDGAGFESGFWFDDFQNYLTEAKGNPYDYYFYNRVNGEGYHLADTIPENSFQEENIILAAADWPQKPDGLTALSQDSTGIRISWNAEPDLTYHIYRRPSGFTGSFFRLDNPAGPLSDPGIADSFFIDTDVFPLEGFDYMIIAEDASGNYSLHSDVVTAYLGIQKVTLDFVVNGGGTFNEYGIPDSIGAGRDVVFYFRFHNESGEPACSFDVSTNFMIYSPDGARWSYTIPDTVDIGKAEFSSFIMECFSCDGEGIDTIGFAGLAQGGIGLYENFDDLAYSITIKPDPADIGKLICIDTIPIPGDAVPPMSDYKWRWTGSASCSAEEIKPLWYPEPLCFYVSTFQCCQGTTGNIDCSANEAPDISDITGLIDNLYLSHKPLCCPEEADVNQSGGDPDISDITTLIDHLYLSHKPLPDCP